MEVGPFTKKSKLCAVESLQLYLTFNFKLDMDRKRKGKKKKAGFGKHNTGQN